MAFNSAVVQFAQRAKTLLQFAVALHQGLEFLRITVELIVQQAAACRYCGLHYGIRRTAFHAINPLILLSSCKGLKGLQK